VQVMGSAVPACTSEFGAEMFAVREEAMTSRSSLIIGHHNGTCPAAAPVPPMGPAKSPGGRRTETDPPAMYLTHRRAGFDTRHDAVDHILISEGNFGTEPGG
jgi:hypothetical protein